jgi:hypothetical protein
MTFSFDIGPSTGRGLTVTSVAGPDAIEDTSNDLDGAQAALRLGNFISFEVVVLELRLPAIDFILGDRCVVSSTAGTNMS